MKTTNNKAHEAIAKFQPFTANNLEAKFENGNYVVLSYGYYPIFVHKDGVWYKNDNGFSPSTKKQMAQCRVYDAVSVSPQTMKSFIY